MVAAPAQMGHRTDGYDGDRRRPEHELHRRDDLGGERRDGEVREERKLTLVTLVQVVRPERDGDGGDLRWTAADRKSTRLNSSHITRSRMPSSA